MATNATSEGPRELVASAPTGSTKRATGSTKRATGSTKRMRRTKRIAIENDDLLDASELAALLAEHARVSELDTARAQRELPREAPGYVAPSTVQRGGWGESIATRFLVERGYRIVERNFRSKVGELDIVATDRGVLCFIEVRSRSSDELGTAAETVDGIKRGKVSSAAMSYLMVRKPKFDRARFDVVAITGDQIELIRDAWRLGDKT